MDETSNRMCIVVFGGTVDKLYPAAIMASGAVMNDMEVDIFLTFWGLMAFQEGAPYEIKAISKDYDHMAQAMMQAMEEKNVPSWYDTLKQAREMGTVRVHACGMTADLFNLGLSDFEPIVDDIIGVGEFVDLAAHSKTTMFLG